MTPERGKEVRRSRRRAKVPAVRRAVIEKHGYKCFYCRTTLMAVADIPDGFLFRVTPHWVEWYDPIAEDVAGARILTIDHRVPVHRGGTADLSNLVPACVSCNGKKGARQMVKVRRNPRFCKTCGAKLEWQRKYCGECKRVNAEAWIANGGECKLRRPKRKENQ